MRIRKAIFFPSTRNTMCNRTKRTVNHKINGPRERAAQLSSAQSSGGLSGVESIVLAADAWAMLSEPDGSPLDGAHGNVGHFISWTTVHGFLKICLLFTEQKHVVPWKVKHRNQFQCSVVLTAVLRRLSAFTRLKLVFSARTSDRCSPGSASFPQLWS